MRVVIVACLVSACAARFLDQSVQGMSIQSNGGYGYQLRLPTFLTSVSEQARQEFIKIISDMTSPRTTVEANITAWAQKNGVADQYKTFEADVLAKKAELLSSIRELLTKLPSAFDQIQQIDNNKALSGNEALTQVEGVFTGMGDRAKTAIMALVNVVYPKGNAVQPLPNQNGGFNNNNNNNNNNGQQPWTFPTQTGTGTGNNGFPTNNNNNNNNGQNGNGFPFGGNQNGNQNGQNTFPFGQTGQNQNGGVQQPLNNNNNNNNNFAGVQRRAQGKQ